MFLKILLMFIVFNCVIGKNEIYKGCKVYSVMLLNEEQQSKFHPFEYESVHFWRIPSLERNLPGLAMVPPVHSDLFEQQLRELGIDIKVHIEDVYEFLEDKEIKLSRSTVKNINGDFNFTRYYRYDEILDYLKDLKQRYENSTTISLELVEYDKTAENRTLVYLKISTREETSNNIKPVIIVEAGINPREWITIQAAINVVKNLLDVNQSRFLSNYEWIVIPVLNPDGYEYTHTNERLWQKSRSLNSNLGLICPGVNINRNFDINFGTSGSSSSPCSHLYAGVNAFSEVESKMIRFLEEHYETRVRLYISLQNNGGFVSYPWQYEKAASGMFKQHHLLAIDMINVMNGNYSLGVASVVLDRASGTSTDYFRSKGVRYTYNIDIVQNDNGVIPGEDIQNIVDDVWRAISLAADEVLY